MCEVARFYLSAGIIVLEGWGLTETCAPATANREAKFRIGTVGPPLPGVDVKVAPDGELVFAWFGTGQLVALTTAAITGLTTSQLRQALATAQVVALSTAQVAALSGTQLAALNTAMVAAL